MRRSPEELLARVSTTRHPIENLLVQFSLLSLVILTILAVVLSIILTTRLNREFELLRGYAAAADVGASRTAEGLLPELDADLNNLILTTYVTVGGGFFILYAGLISIVWRAWRTIKSQEGDLIETNADLREAYQELQEAQERLVRTERLAAIGQLSAGVAHDLRNPLGAIKNSVYYLKGKLRDSELAEDNPRIVEFLDIMEEEVDSSNQILSGLMDYARVNEPQTTPTQLESVVDSALARFNIKSSVKVIKSFDHALPQVMVDRDQLLRAFGNLLKNADEAMPEGGTLAITGKAVNGYVELGFRDTGEGIDAPDLARIMDPLFTTKAKGIGLGLAIINMVIERHRGAIDVTSEKGEGTTFTIRLPNNGASQAGQTGDGDVGRQA